MADFFYFSWHKQCRLKVFLYFCNRNILLEKESQQFFAPPTNKPQHFFCATNEGCQLTPYGAWALAVFGSVAHGGGSPQVDCLFIKGASRLFSGTLTWSTNLINGGIMNLMLNVKEGRPQPERKGSYEWLKTMIRMIQVIHTYDSVQSYVSSEQIIRMI